MPVLLLRLLKSKLFLMFLRWAAPKVWQAIKKRRARAH